MVAREKQLFFKRSQRAAAEKGVFTIQFLQTISET
jgi:hypothetical protein